MTEAEARVAMIELTGVSKSFTTKDVGVVAALKEVSLTIEGNEFFTLLGPSGCGKTTLLRLIGGFEAPSTGQIRIDNECPLYDDGSRSTEMLTLIDANGLTSNSLSASTTRPPGAP